MMNVSNPLFSEKSVGTVLIALIGPLMIWALHFSVVYGAHHIICATLASIYVGFWMQTVVGVATVTALLALLLLILKPDAVLRMKRDEAMSKNSRLFLTGVMRLLALLSLFGVLWAGSAAFFFPACRSLV